jgi:hypothetical protein
VDTGSRAESISRTMRKCVKEVVICEAQAATRGLTSGRTARGFPVGWGRMWGWKIGQRRFSLAGFGSQGWPVGWSTDQLLAGRPDSKRANRGRHCRQPTENPRQRDALSQPTRFFRALCPFL